MSDVLGKAVNQVLRNELAMRIRQWLQRNKHMMPRNMASRYAMEIGDEDGEMWKIRIKVWRTADEYKYLLKEEKMKNKIEGETE